MTIAPRPTDTKPETAPTSVYRYYDKSGVLLYVGITSRRTRRQLEHNSDKEWWPFVARQEVDHYPNRVEAEVQERGLIRRYRPPFNKQHNPEHAEMRELYLASGLGGNKVMRGGRKRPKLTPKEARQAFARTKGHVGLRLVAADRHHLTYETTGDVAPMVNAAQFGSDVLLLAPTKIATYQHYYVDDGRVEFIFLRTSDGRPPNGATLYIKARQPFSLYAWKAVAS